MLVIDDAPDDAMHPFAEYAAETDDERTNEVKFDYYGIAIERHLLRLLQPKRPAFLAKLFGAKCREFVSQARNCEIDIDQSNLGDVAAVLEDGKWHSCPWVNDDSPEMKRWEEEVVRRLRSAPDNVLVTIMNCHL
ncbi:hypothetical protein [Botrimarina mediterranea]|uniref:hypothetical protein n=1 Tax=Botrimarina mediterranea TaxID=2528022 RepID=UPI0011A87455|nr:hypothetical protein [Botrimarina mediterranea]